MSQCSVNYKPILVISLLGSLRCKCAIMYVLCLDKRREDTTEYHQLHSEQYWYWGRLERQSRTLLNL